MAKLTSSVAFKNATINLDEGTITEYLKDDNTKEYQLKDILTNQLKDILTNWNHIDGISFSIKRDCELPTHDEADDCGEDE